MKKKQVIGSIMLLLAAVLWGMSYGIQSIMSNKLGPYTVIFLKGFSGVFLVLYCLIFNKTFNKKTVIAGAFIGVINCIGLIYQQMGLSITSVSKTSFISGLYILFVPLIQAFTNVKPKNKFWFAVAVACLGMYFLCMNGSFSLNKGDLYVLIAAICFAFQIILIDKNAKTSDFVSLCAAQQMTISIIAGILMIVFEKPQLSDFSGLLLPILYAMFASGMIAQLMQNRYQRDVEPTLASLIMSLESVFGALSGWLLLNQGLSPRELIGCILIFISIIIAE